MHPEDPRAKLLSDTHDLHNIRTENQKLHYDRDDLRMAFIDIQQAS